MALIHFQQKIYPQNALAAETEAGILLSQITTEKYLSRLRYGALHSQSPILALTTSLCFTGSGQHGEDCGPARGRCIVAPEGELPIYLTKNSLSGAKNCRQCAERARFLQ